MSELAFNANGEPFEVPEGVTGWRVRRMKGTRGQPEVVYGPDGPLTLSLDAGLDDLRNAVGTAGRYRLDPIDGDSKLVTDAPIAYAQVVAADKSERPNERHEPVVLTSMDLALREMVRATTELARTNTELAKSLVSEQPGVMQATAEILRAADGAGLPARTPRLGELDDDLGDEDAGEADASKRLDLVGLLEKVIPLVLPAILEKLPGIGELLDPRKAAAAGAAARERKRIAGSAAQAPKQASGLVAAETVEEPSAPEASERSAVAHIMAIQAALDPSEAEFAQAAAAGMTASERLAWFDELGKLSVVQAVERIRGEIAKAKGGVS